MGENIPRLLRRPSKKEQEDESTARELVAEEQIKEQKIVGTAALNTEPGRAAARNLAEKMPISRAKKQQLKRAVEDPAEVAEVVNQGELKREQGRTQTPKQTFMSTMALFLPTVLAGIGGAIEGGSAGAAAGLKGGMEGTKFGLDIIQSMEKHSTGLTKTEAETDLLKAKLAGEGSGKGADFIKQPFTIKPEYQNQYGSGILFPKIMGDKVIFEREDGVRVPQEAIERPQDINAALSRDQRQMGLDEAKLNQLNKAKDVFVDKRVKNDKERLEQLDQLQELLDSGTKIAGQIDFKMAKGIAGEVGNLAESEREVAARIVGLEGQIDKLEEWLTSDITDTRRKEIQKLIDYIRPRTKKRIAGKAVKYAKERSKRYELSQEDLVQDLLDEANVDFPAAKAIRLQELREKASK